MDVEKDRLPPPEEGEGFRGGGIDRGQQEGPRCDREGEAPEICKATSGEIELKTGPKNYTLRDRSRNSNFI